MGVVDGRGLSCSCFYSSKDQVVALNGVVSYFCTVLASFFSYPAICLQCGGREGRREVRAMEWSCSTEVLSGLGGGVRGGGRCGAQRRTNTGTKSTWKR